MSLDCTWGKCPAAKDATSGEIQTMCFSMMFVGMSGITERNLVEYVTRIRIWEGVHGSLMNRNKCATCGRAPREAMRVDTATGLAVASTNGPGTGAKEYDGEYFLACGATVQANGLASYEHKYEPTTEDFPITAEYAKGWIGLSTNVSDDTPAQFTKRVYDGAKRDAAAAVKRAGIEPKKAGGK